MSKILNKIFDADLYNTVKAERYELDQNGNKNMYNIGQLEGLAEQGNEEAKAIVDKVNNEVDEMLKKMDSGNYLFKILYLILRLFQVLCKHKKLI